MRIDEEYPREQVVRKASAVGNGAHIFVPKDWLGEKVILIRAEPKKNPKDLILEKLRDMLDAVVGIYLVGSHARGEAKPESDIDFLVITNKLVKFENTGRLHIMAVAEDNISSSIKKHPVLMHTLLREALPIMNAALLEKMRQRYKPVKSDFLQYLKETENVLTINRELLDGETKSADLNESAYSIILRLRGMYLVKTLLAGGRNSNITLKSFVLKHCKVDYNSIYSAYESVKLERRDKIVLDSKELLKIIGLIEEEISIIREK